LKTKEERLPMSLLERLCGIENLLKKENVGVPEFVTTISEMIGCNTYLLNSEGGILGVAMLEANGHTKTKSGTSTLRPEFKQRIGFMFETAPNLPLEASFLKEEDSFSPDSFMTIVPIRNIRSTAAHLILTKKGKQFTEEELVLAETASLVACIYSYETDGHGGETELRQKANVQLVLDSLSFSELKAISNVFKDLNGLEGFLVASKIADRIGISRSVIVNAMRKLESAGVVDSHSLGIKGTYIKIKNVHFLDALNAKVK
jgi:transcriptional pleiotropic repressor